jgi:mevalonate pyrophosphate decarboxylase
MKTSKDMKRITGFALAIAAALGVIVGCSGGPKVNTSELDNKGRAVGVSTPDWIKLYVAEGITAVQAQPQFKDKYCIIGEETSSNRQFALACADNFSAQQRIGAMLRTNIASKYEAAVTGASQSAGGANSTAAAGAGSAEYKQEINNLVSAAVNVSYSGAQRDSDWWVLTRRYDPDQKDVFSDEYTAYVLYTIPKAELNRQIANALETSVAKDSALYDVTIQLAKDILTEGFEYLDPTAE